jgi:hypothetical protein
MDRGRPGALLDRAPLKFSPRDGLAFFERIGWKAKDIRATFHEAARLRRLPQDGTMVGSNLRSCQPFINFRRRMRGETWATSCPARINRAWAKLAR